MSAWRCVICKREGQAPDDKAAERLLGRHWMSEHFGREVDAEPMQGRPE